MKTKKVVVGVVILISTIILWVLFNNEGNWQDLKLKEDQITSIPKGEVHWHPRLTIVIDNEKVPIPIGIGIDMGRKVDTHLSGMSMSPTHTHESDGTIHIENKNPKTKPETVTLGYFFYVWDKNFNSTCIFEYCTEKGILKMSVNGKENNEFQNYLMRDKDNIVIEYTSNKKNG